MWTEISSSVPHFLQIGLLLGSIKYKCLLKVLCPVSRPITTLDCVLLMDSNWAPVTRLGPEINSRACLCVLQGPRHNGRCCFSIQCFWQMLFLHPVFHLSSYILPRDPKERLRSNKLLNRLSLASLWAISFPLSPAWPGTQYSPTACRVEISFSVCWHCRTNVDGAVAHLIW